MPIRSRGMLLALLVSVAMFYTTGCLGRPAQRQSRPLFGTIQGRVVSEATPQTGVAGVYVYVQDTSIATFTDDDGLYTLNNVPAGQHTVVIEYPEPGVQPFALVDPLTLTPDGDQRPRLTQASQPMTHEAIDSVSLQQVTVRVDVQAGSVSVVSTVSVPMFGAVDNLSLYHVTPRVGQTLAAGVEASFYLDIHYALNTFDEAFVVAMLSWPTLYGEEYPHVQEALYVTKGSGSAVLQLTAIVPAQPRVNLHIALVDANGFALAMKSFEGYRVGYGQGAVAPELTILGYADHHLYFSVSGGNPVGFERYELYSGSLTGGCDGIPLFISEDPHLDLIALPFPYEGAMHYYRLCMVTDDGTKIQGDSVGYAIPKYGIQKFSIQGPVADMLADPVRDVIYIADSYRNQVSVLSTVTDRIEDVIRVGPAPGRLAVSDDGTYLYVAHANGSQVAEIDLITRQIERWIPVLPQATAIAVHTASRHLYVGSQTESLQAIDLDTQEVLLETAFKTGLPIKRLTLSDDGTLLLATAGAGATFALSTQDFAEPAYLWSSHAEFIQPVVVGDRIFITRQIYDANTFEFIDDNPYHPIAYNPNEDRLYVFGGVTPDLPAGHSFDYIYELTYDGDAGRWAPTARVMEFVRHSSDRGVLASDGRYLYIPVYYGAYSVELVKIHLAVRRSGNPQ